MYEDSKLVPILLPTASRPAGWQSPAPGQALIFIDSLETMAYSIDSWYTLPLPTAGAGRFDLAHVKENS